MTVHQWSEMFPPFGRDESTAAILARRSKYRHNDQIQSSTLTQQQFEVTSGPHKGKKAITFERTPYFPFEKLLPELRQEIYKLVFANPDPVYLGNFTNEKIDTDRVRRQLRWTSLLRANRAIGAEAKQVLWGSQHFIVDSSKAASAAAVRTSLT